MKTARITAGAMVVIAAVAVGMSLGDGVLAQGGGGGRGGGGGTCRGTAHIDDPSGRGHAAAGRFVHDQELLSRSAVWPDKRYARCNTPRQLTDMWARENRPAHWGDCNLDRPVDKIATPTVQDRRRALPGVDGRSEEGRWPDDAYTTDASRLGWQVSAAGQEEQWIWGRNLQASTMLSLLTPEYQKRMVQMMYHEAVSNAPQWMAAFCYPEGFMRWWSQAALGGPIEVMVTPKQVQFLSGIADNLLRRVLVGRTHVQKVPQWYGETVGFWNGNTLVAWTANVQGWTLSHSMFEFSSKMETIEVLRPSADGKTITVEATFYDPEAFTRPLHTVTPWERTRGLDDPEQRFSYVECRVQSTIINGPDGRPTQMTPVDEGYIDYFGRPWAQNWESKFEQGWKKPEN